jgi:hypothetical protein
MQSYKAGKTTSERYLKLGFGTDIVLGDLQFLDLSYY